MILLTDVVWHMVHTMNHRPLMSMFQSLCFSRRFNENACCALIDTNEAAVLLCRRVAGSTERSLFMAFFSFSPHQSPFVAVASRGGKPLPHTGERGKAPAAHRWGGKLPLPHTGEKSRGIQSQSHSPVQSSHSHTQVIRVSNFSHTHVTHTHTHTGKRRKVSVAHRWEEVSTLSHKDDVREIAPMIYW